MFTPTDEQRRTVRALSGYGVPQEGIAIHIGIDAKTLRKHFRQDLDRGSVEATAKVAQSLFHLATVDKNVAAAIFWMKARAGWREKQEIQFSNRPIEQLSDADLERLIARLGEDPEIEGELADVENDTPRQRAR
jgi:5,10-methylene-tetrahydrofolate dehydrogenase/methenyl tetrahydrofolate cyclohydrolase